MPPSIGDDRLLGGLDLAATLAAGLPVVERGLLEDADGGLLVIPGAERLEPGPAGRIAAALDLGAVAIERDGIAAVRATRFAVVALDESATEDESVPAVLADRLGMLLSLDGLAIRDIVAGDGMQLAVERARRTISAVKCPESATEALCATALALGVGSLRAPIAARAVAAALAALDGRIVVDQGDLSLAAALVIAPRATRLPATEEPANDAEPDPPPPEPPEQTADDRGDSGDMPDLDDAEMQAIVLAAATAALPKDVLDRLAAQSPPRGSSGNSGRHGPKRKARSRGRPAGTRSGRLGPRDRLDLIATLRSAAPWQRLRAMSAAVAAAPASAPRVRVHASDFRIRRVKHPVSTTTIFVVDASGSAALHRLAEAKGAVELMLADCYVRRDSVALIAFRGKTADLLLPETRSLARAKRCLAGLAGGGRTPLASAIAAALDAGLAVRRKGNDPSIVFLTDGISNVSLAGLGGRSAADDDVAAVARLFRAAGLKSLVIDTSPRGQAQAERLAPALGAEYLLMPYAGAMDLSRAARTALAQQP